MKAWIVCAAMAAPAVASAEPPAAAVRAVDVAAELARLEGHRVEVAGGGYRIVDVAGEGAPIVGVVERRGSELWLRPAQGPALRLRGPLAVPRIAGPGYKVWATGRVVDGSLAARRLGVLAAPRPRRGR